ncbi:unnamed protein product, partial [Closterium sp. NIES-65]
ESDRLRCPWLTPSWGCLSCLASPLFLPCPGERPSGTRDWSLPPLVLGRTWGRQRAAPHSFPVSSDRGPVADASHGRVGPSPRPWTGPSTLPDSPQQNGIAERRIAMVMDVARTSMMHAAAPHFLWPFAVSFTTPPLDVFCPPRTSRSTESVPYYRLFPYRTPSSPNPALLGASLVESTGDSGAAGGAEPGGAESGGAEPGGAVPGGAEPGGTVPGVLRRLSGATLPTELREWFARRWRRAAGAGGSSAAEGTAAARPRRCSY